MTLIKRLRNGDELHREAADALKLFEAMSEFVLSDDERSLAFVRWQRAKGSVIAQRSDPVEMVAEAIYLMEPAAPGPPRPPFGGLVQGLAQPYRDKARAFLSPRCDSDD